MTWNRIERIAEQGMDRRVVLLTETGVPLLHIEPWLHDVQELIARIVERGPPSFAMPVRARLVLWERVYLAIVGLVAIVGVAITVWKGDYCLVSILVLPLAYFASGFADRVFALTLETDRMVLVTLRGRVVVPRDQIFRIRVAGFPNREPCVEVAVAGRSLPVWLFRMDVGTVELARSLQAWRGSASIL